MAPDLRLRDQGMSRRITDLRIRTKLFAGFAALLAILLAAGLAGLHRLESGMRAQIGESSRSLARSIVEQAGRDVYARLAAVRQLALTTAEIEDALRRSNDRLAASGTASEIRDRVEGEDGAWSAFVQDGAAAGREMPPFMAEAETHPVSEILRRQIDFFRRESGHAVFSEIFVTNRFGVNVAQTSLTSDYRQDDEGWWTGAWSDGVHVGDVAFDDSSGVFSIDFAVRVDGAGGEPLGVMKAVLDIEEVHRVLAAFDSAVAARGATLELLDRRGSTLYPPSGARSEAAAPPAEGTWLAADDAGVERLYSAARASSQGPYPDLGWTLVVSFPRASIFAPVRAHRRQLLAAGAVVSLLALAAAAAIALSITRPLERAVEASRRLADGDLRVVLEKRRGDETGRLLAALGTMVANVRRTIESLVEVSGRVRSLAGTLSETADRIAEGAGEQSRAIGDGVAAVQAMTESIERIALASSQMRDGVFETAAAAEEMATSTEVVARNTVQLAAGVDETLEAVRHLAASIELVSAGAGAAGESSRKALAEAESGGEAVRRTIEEMAAIDASADEMVAVVEHLLSSSESIGQATELIEDLARQTHLLALNAAIQAANAGVHGKGFAVVAEEVQRLAERSAGSTHDIAELVAAVQEDAERAARISRQGADKTRLGATLAGRAGEALERIVRSAARVEDSLEEIGRFAGEQAGVAEELVTTFQQMRRRTLEVEQATREQAAGSERIRDAMSQVTGQAQKAADAVRHHRDDARLVDEAVAHVTRVTAEQAATAEEIVHATEALGDAAEALRDRAGFFVVA